MSNAFMGQRQQASPMGFGGFGGYQQPQPFSPFSGGYGGGMGGFPQGGGMMYGDMMYRGPGATGGGPMGGGMGGFGTTFGGYGMGGGGYDMGYGGSPLLPPPQPTVNDLFSQYFSQQYYGGPAFNPFAATSFFGGGYGGGFGFGGGGGMGRRGRGGRMRPQPMPVRGGGMQAQPLDDMVRTQPFTQPGTIGAPPPRLSQLFASEFSPMQYSGPQDQLAMQLTEPARSAVMPQLQEGTGTRLGGSREFTGPNAAIDMERAMERDRIARESAPLSDEASRQLMERSRFLQPAVMPQPEPVMRPAVMPQPPPQFTPLPYMGGFSLPFDSALPAKVEAPVAPAVQGVETIMPVPVQDTPVQAPPPVTMPVRFDEPPMPPPAVQLPAFGGYEAEMPIPVQQAPVYAAPMFVDPFERAMMRGGFR